MFSKIVPVLTLNDLPVFLQIYLLLEHTYTFDSGSKGDTTPSSHIKLSRYFKHTSSVGKASVSSINELNDFIIKLGAFCERAIDAKQKTPYEKVPDFITEENVVELCFALIMTETFDDVDLIVETRKIGELLRNVQGENEIVAAKLADFLYGPDHRENVMKKNIDNRGGVFSRFQYFEILDRILP